MGEKILKSKPLSKIIMLVSQGVNYNYLISKHLNQGPDYTHKKLKKLLDNKYLNKKTVQPKNKKIYSVNWNRLMEEFHHHVKTHIPECLNEKNMGGKMLRDYRKKKYLKDLIDEKNKEKKKIISEFKDEYFKKIYNNPYLINLFNLFFKRIIREELNVSLYDVFSKLIRLSIFESKNNVFEDEASETVKKDKDFQIFIKFLNMFKKLNFKSNKLKDSLGKSCLNFLETIDDNYKSSFMLRPGNYPVPLIRYY